MNQSNIGHVSNKQQLLLSLKQGTDQQVHEEDRHDDEENNKQEVANSFVGNQVGAVIEDGIKFKFSNHHH